MPAGAEQCTLSAESRDTVRRGEHAG